MLAESVSATCAKTTKINGDVENWGVRLLGKEAEKIRLFGIFSCIGE